MEKVLVVDDTKNIRTLLKTCLEIEGYEVYEAKDGKQALQLLNEVKYDLIFLDIKMPEVSGTEVLKRIRSCGILTPVIIMTAFATVKNAIECTNMGAIAYVQKPFTADKVRGVLKELDLNKVIKDEKDNMKDIIFEAKAYIDENNYISAIEVLKKALSIDIGNKEIYLLLNNAFIGLGDQENADRFYKMYKSF